MAINSLTATSIVDARTHSLGLTTAGVDLLTVASGQSIRVKSLYFGNLSTTQDQTLTVKVYDALTSASIALLTSTTLPAACGLVVVDEESKLFLPTVGDKLNASAGVSAAITALASYEIMS